jgi:RNA polymerase sigma-70 factor (ECF subfamily)
MLARPRKENGEDGPVREPARARGEPRGGPRAEARPRGEDGADAPAIAALADRELVILARAGGRPALAELARRHLPVVYRLSLRLLGSRDGAADASQEVFLRAFRALDGFHLERSFRAWLCAIAWNLARDAARRARRRPVRMLGDSAVDLPDRRGPSPFEQAAAKERAAALTEALERLPPRRRALLVLFEVEGLSYDELSQLLGCGLGTVKSKVHRARRELKDSLLALRPDLFREDPLS